jgi:putative Mg2+ transporter-C (MgtC) family protein
MFENLLTGYELYFALDLVLCTVFGFLIGAERESRGKDAGISTHILVIAGAMLFTFVSQIANPTDNTRIAANIVTGIGFLGAGLILKGEGGRVRNLTTAASLWFSAGIGIAIGFGYYLVAALAAVACIVMPRLPHIHPHSQESMEDQAHHNSPHEGNAEAHHPSAKAEEGQ